MGSSSAPSRATPGAPAPARDPWRERTLADAFVTLSDALAEDFDVVAFLHALVAASADMSGVAAATVTLGVQTAPASLLAGSDDRARRLELLQLELGEGPCPDCLRGGNRTRGADLAVESARWPRFAPAALAAGFRSVDVLPLRSGADTVGALSLFDGSVSPPDTEHHLVRALADVAATALASRWALRRDSVVAADLQRALDSLVPIEQAKGILSQRHGIDLDAAFGELRRQSRDSNDQLAVVAAAIVRAQAGLGRNTDAASEP